MFFQTGIDVMQPAFWLGFSKIVWIDILLSGDNALVIALACHGLAPRRRLWGMVLGAGGAVLLRILFTGTVTSLMALPFLKIVGGLALLYVATKLLMPDDGANNVNQTDKLWSAVRTVIAADIVMSIDNVIAVAAAAHGNILLLGAALAISIPLIVAGAAIITGFLNRFPVLIWAGAGLLGWIAGDVIASDASITSRFGAAFAETYVSTISGACLVLAVGLLWRLRSTQSQAA